MWWTQYILKKERTLPPDQRFEIIFGSRFPMFKGIIQYPGYRVMRFLFDQAVKSQDNTGSIRGIADLSPIALTQLLLTHPADVLKNVDLTKNEVDPVTGEYKGELAGVSREFIEETQALLMERITEFEDIEKSRIK